MRERLAYLLDWGTHIYQEFRDQHASLTAAAIALFGLLSLFPLLLLALEGITFALGSAHQALAQIRAVMQDVLVGNAGTTLTDLLAGVVLTRGIASALAALGFLWIASRVFTIMMDGLDIAWDVRQRRPLIRRNLLAIGMVFLAFLFGILMFALPLAVGLLRRYSGEAARWAGIHLGTPVAWSILANLLAYAATIGLFSVLYKVLPNRHVHWRPAVVGAVVAGTIWEIARYLFQLYLVNFGAFNKVYGALAGVVVLILWLNYSAMILLLGAITSAVYSARVYHDRDYHPQSRAFDERRAA